MADYEIPLYITCDAYNQYGAGLRYDVKSYIEHFISQVGESASVILPNFHVSVPTEDPYESFTALDVKEHSLDMFSCSGGDDSHIHLRQYSSLGLFIHELAKEFSNQIPYSKDNVILLTAANGGGRSWNGWNNPDEPIGGSAVGGTEYLQDLPSQPVRFNNNLSGDEQVAHSHMQTVLHELGHCLLKANLGGSEWEHETGELVWDVPHEERSPMGINGQNSNYCGTTYNNPGNLSYQLQYSDCCASKWKDPGSTW